MKAVTLSLTFIILLFTLSCTESKDQALSISLIESPTQPNSLTPNLFTSREGQVYLSWLEKKDSTTQFKFSKLEGESWSTPTLIAEGSNWFVNWADFPSLIVNGDQFSAHWLQKRAAGTYDYDVRIAQSADKGKTWSASFIPHKDGVAAEHGFVSMLAMNKDENFATWLDGRNTKAAEGEGHNGHGGAMSLRAGTFNGIGEMLRDDELDNSTCDCCQTTAALTSKGPIVAYRDRSDTEIRDIYITRLVHGEWTTPKAVHNDNWNIEGCPVNGPSLSAKDNKVAIAWFTAAQGFAEVKLAFSSDAGESFSLPMVLAKGNTNGRVGTSILPNGNTAVTWMENEGDMANIQLAVFGTQGKELKRTTIAQSTSSRSSGFPVITQRGESLMAAWTETGETSQVKTAKIFFQ